MNKDYRYFSRLIRMSQVQPGLMLFAVRIKEAQIRYSFQIALRDLIDERRREVGSQRHMARRQVHAVKAQWVVQFQKRGRPAAIAIGNKTQKGGNRIDL